MTGHLMASTGINPGEHNQATVFGLTLNVDTIISTVVAAAIVVILAFALRASAKKASGVPGGVQLFFETVTKFLREQVETMIGFKTAPFVLPLALALFTFILCCNWLSVLPTHIQGADLLAPPTADVNLVYPLALMVFVWKHVAGSRRHGGPGHQLAHTLKGHNKFLAPMWVIEEISGVVSHALRLFGNLFAGGLMIAVIGSLLPFYFGGILNGAWKLFDLFIGLIQAFIFAFLTIVYFGQAMENRDEHH
jgi:F-type H+-transporting ATPase subunit a